MKYLREFHDPATAAALAKELAYAGNSFARSGRSAVIMEVCGTHTMAIARHGIRSLLPPNIQLISGPGCPVCVTEPGYIDTAIELARRGVIVVTFGDLLAVPGSESSLANARAAGARIVVCYSPAETLRIAAQHQNSEVVFLAVGFETTIAPIVSTLEAASKNGVKNLSFLTAFKRVIPAMKALVSDTSNRIDAFLCPGHVSAIIGVEPYQEIATSGIPCVIAGFEPIDILQALLKLVDMVKNKEASVINLYSRVVRQRGNPKAQELIDTFLVPSAARWRGLGEIPDSGFSFRETWRHFDAEARHGVRIPEGRQYRGCLCGEIVKGKIPPEQCSHFGRKCTPESPVGPCMVSSEGTCAAYYKYISVQRS